MLEYSQITIGRGGSAGEPIQGVADIGGGELDRTPSTELALPPGQLASPLALFSHAITRHDLFPVARDEVAYGPLPFLAVGETEAVSKSVFCLSGPAFSVSLPMERLRPP